MTSTLWYDMSSLRSHTGAVTGIQRAIGGVASALRAGETRHPVRYCVFRKKRGFFELDTEFVDALLVELAAGRAQGAPVKTATDRLRARIEKMISGKPAPVTPFAPGDVLLNLGFNTYSQRHQALVSELIARSGVHYVGMVYDFLMSRFPEWWDPEQQHHTDEWFGFTGRIARVVLSCSDATRRDAEWFFAREGIGPVALRTVRLADELADSAATPSDGAAPARPFVLYVSTIEVRKNHRLLFQVWKRLLERRDPATVPDLVFVGRKGWLVGDFLTELHNAAYLGGRIQLRHGVDDAELARLYATCLFTVYPTIAEGWGLPVAESLARGKYCVASGTSSLPEIGGDLVDYHDPFDVPGALALIERAIYEPGWREGRERAIRAGFRTQSWLQCREEIEAALAPLFGAAPAASNASH